jgi:hypothetical protein
MDASAAARHHLAMWKKSVGVWLVAAVVWSMVGACPSGIGDDETSDRADDDDDEDEGELRDSTEVLEPDTDPCLVPEAWPYSTTSERHPIRIHWRTRAEEPTAREMLGYLDDAWAAQVDDLGFPAPITDELSDTAFGCGPDARVDVFIFAGIEIAYVDVVVEDASTPNDDYAAFMVVDPFGENGGPLLEATVFHEFHHVTQAALDWLDAPNIYEMSATFVEEAVLNSHDSWEFQLFDVTDNPEWSIDLDDNYETYFMYGQALYLIFLQHAVFGGDIDFFVQMWRGLASPTGEPPTYQDALDVLLADHGLSFVETVPLYARWMAYVGERDDGAHFPRGALYPDVAATTIDVDGDVESVTVRPMMLGSAHLDLAASEPVRVALTSSLPASARVVVQQIPGASGDGDVLTLPATVPAGSRLVVTVMPTGPYSVFERSNAQIPLTLTFSPTTP